jgi:hypothetical protein
LSWSITSAGSRSEVAIGWGSTHSPCSISSLVSWLSVSGGDDERFLAIGCCHHQQVAAGIGTAVDCDDGFCG